MSDEEDYDDELPAITVSARSERSFELVMPSADQLVAERERESDCERELRRLQELCDRLEATPAPAPNPTPALGRLTHSDSSGSEGEAALAAAMSALSVPRAGAKAGPRGTAPGVGCDALLAALATHLPPEEARLLHDYRQLSERATPSQLRRATEQMVVGICGGGACADSDAAWVAAAAWLAALQAAPPAPRATRRALHHLLDDRLTHDQIVELARWLDAAIVAAAAAAAGGGGAAARALLALGDAARGGGAGGALLAARLRRAALVALHPALAAHLAGQDEADASAEALCGATGGAWGALPPRARCLALQLCARALGGAGGAGGAAGRLLAAVAQAPRAAAVDAAHAPDHLKVGVAVARLRLLFAPRPP